MAFGNHALNERRIRGCNIDGTFSKIVSRHEKCGVEAKLLQRVQQLTGVQVGSVIVGQGYHVFLCAVIDVVVVRDTPEQRSRIV